MPAKAKRPRKPEPPKFPQITETYGDPSWTIGRVRSEPTCFNGIVEIVKYRITVEVVEEPVEVLRERLRKLWRETPRNTHTWHPMHRAAEELGMDPKKDLPYEDQGADATEKSW